MYVNRYEWYFAPTAFIEETAVTRQLQLICEPSKTECGQRIALAQTRNKSK